MFREVRYALQSAVLAAQPVLEPSVHDALEPTNEAPEDLDPSMSQSIEAVLGGVYSFAVVCYCLISDIAIESDAVPSARVWGCSSQGGSRADRPLSLRHFRGHWWHTFNRCVAFSKCSVYNDARTRYAVVGVYLAS